MPFTLVHPGYAIWLKNKFPKLDWTGLIIGSITPDFDILFRLTNSRFHIFGFDGLSIILMVVITLITSMYFHLFCRNVIIKNLPTNIKQLLTRYKNFDYLNFLSAHFLVSMSSIIIGILFHFGIDFIFHWNAWRFMEIVCFPLHKLGIDFSYNFTVVIYQIGIYLPQFIGTGIGLFLLYYFFKYNIPETSLIKLIYDINKRQTFFWLLILSSSVGIALLRISIWGYEGNGWGVLNISIYLTSGFIVSFFVIPFLFYIFDSSANKERK